MFIKHKQNQTQFALIIYLALARSLKSRLLTAMILAVMVLAHPGASAQSTDAVGVVRLVIGDVGLESAVSGSRLLERGDNIYQGDQVTTPATGYAVITLVDETKFTIKPNSIFKFETVDNQPVGRVLTELLKGGLKAITGSIGLQNPPGFKIDTPLGSIGIRGTNLDARLCQGDECLELHEMLGCPTQPPETTDGFLYVTVAQGIAYLDNCEDDPDIMPGQVGVTDGSATGCKILDEVPCFLTETVWQQEQQKDETLESLELPVLQQMDDQNFLCQGDPICIQCQGDPLCIQCQGDPECYQCQGDPICLQCMGDPLCIQCQGDPLCIQCQGDPQCIQCQGDPLCVQCAGDMQCIQCQGDPLCIQCQGDFECIRCNGNPACINGDGQPGGGGASPADPCVINPMGPGCPMEDPCLQNPFLTGCPMDPCMLDPTSPGCPNDPCVVDPTSPGCPNDPCILDPMSPGCPMDPCVVDPNSTTCVCITDPQNPLCNPQICTTPVCFGECGSNPSLDCLCSLEPDNPACL